VLCGAPFENKPLQPQFLYTSCNYFKKNRPAQLYCIFRYSIILTWRTHVLWELEPRLLSRLSILNAICLSKGISASTVKYSGRLAPLGRSDENPRLFHSQWGSKAWKGPVRTFENREISKIVKFFGRARIGGKQRAPPKRRGAPYLFPQIGLFVIWFLKWLLSSIVLRTSTCLLRNFPQTLGRAPHQIVYE
jgi:hypothetical protein